MKTLVPACKIALPLRGDTPPYALHLAHSGTTLFAATSDNSVLAYDLASPSPPVAAAIPHSAGVTHLAHYNRSILAASARDGSVVFWDTRCLAKPAALLKGEEPLCSFDFDGKSLVAAGTELVGSDAKIKFWDIRTQRPVTEFVESHSDDVTQLKFHPSKRTLLSGSTDRLVNIFTLPLTTEDDNLLYTLSFESVHRLDFFGPSREYLLALSHIETMSAYSLDADLVREFGDVRKPSALDYAVDMFYDDASERLYLVGGTYSGDLSFSHVNMDGVAACTRLAGGHSETVRAVVIDTKNEVVISGGEDSQICVWKHAPESQ